MIDLTFFKDLCGCGFMIFIGNWKSRCVVKVISSGGNKIIEKNLNSKKIKIRCVTKQGCHIF